MQRQEKMVWILCTLFSLDTAQQILPLSLPLYFSTVAYNRIYDTYFLLKILNEGILLPPCTHTLLFKKELVIMRKFGFIIYRIFPKCSEMHFSPFLSCQPFTSLPVTLKTENTHSSSPIHSSSIDHPNFSPQDILSPVIPHPLVILSFIFHSSVIPHRKHLAISPLKLTCHHLPLLSRLFCPIFIMLDCPLTHLHAVNLRYPVLSLSLV